MFSEYEEIFIHFKKIIANDQEIGEIRKREGSPFYIQNLLYTLANFNSGCAVDVEIVDSNQQVFGYIRKQSGIKPKDFHLFDTEQNYVGAIQTTWINKKYVVVDREKKSVLEMPIMTSGIDYDVKDIEKDRNIASIRKRTLVTYGGQANLSREGFYMPIMDLPDRTLMIIGLCYVLNFYIQT